MTKPSPVWTIALLVACGGHQPTKATGASPDCFALLTEPPEVDCNDRVPLSAETIKQRAAASACLLDLNRAALERAKHAALRSNSLVPADLATIDYPEVVTSEWRHPREQLVPLRELSTDCRQRPFPGQSVVARDETGQLVRIDLRPEITQTRQIKSCACTGCGPVPPPLRVEFAILPPGATVTRTITVTWPVQTVDIVPLVGACA